MTMTVEQANIYRFYFLFAEKKHGNLRSHLQSEIFSFAATNPSIKNTMAALMTREKVNKATITIVITATTTTTKQNRTIRPVTRQTILRPHIIVNITRKM